MLIYSEKFWQNEKHHENSFMLTSLKKFLWQINDLISTLVNKFATIVLRTDRQYSYHIRETDFKTECLIWMLLLQVITQSKIRLTADNFILFKKLYFLTVLLKRLYFLTVSLKNLYLLIVLMLERRNLVFLI